MTSVLYGAGTGTVGANIVMSFGEWRIEMESGTPEITNFNTTPYKAHVPGLVGATCETDMPGYNAGNTPLTCSNPYQLTLSWTNSLSIIVTAILKKLTAANKADGTPSIKASWQVTGAFTAAVT